MESTIRDLLQVYGENKLVIAVVSAIAGLILGKLLPVLFGQVYIFLAWIARLLGGRFAYRDFQKRYLDWVVTEHRELKLTGVVTTDDAKKPRLEQVFISLRMARQRLSVSTQSSVVEGFSLEGELPSWEIIQELLHLQRRKRGDDKLAKMTRRIEMEMFSNSIIEQTRKKRLKKRIYNSQVESTDDTAERMDWLKSYGYLIEDAIGEYQLKLILSRQNRVAILGAPGAGKTTLLQYIALTHARERAADSKLRERGILKRRLGGGKWRLPIFIRLSSVASLLEEIQDKNRDPSIVDILPRILPPDLQRNSVASEYFELQLRRGNCIVLLDGLDEIPTDTEFHSVVRAIESLCLRYGSNQFVVTSRVAGWRSGVDGDFEIFYVSDLTDSQVNTFIDTWYASVERNAIIGRLQDEGESERKARERRGHQRADDLKTTLRDNLGIRRLAINPMLLSIISVVHRSLASLPKERSKLYAQCGKILLEQWDISRGVRVDDTNLKLEQKEALMRRLAVAFHTGEVGDKSGGREASVADIQKIIAAMLPSLGKSPDEAAHLLQMLVERSGILVERQRGVLAFAHLTFQEYFTAQHLAIGEHAQNREFLLKPENLTSDWWREVILLYSGLLSDSSEFVRRIASQPSDDLTQPMLRLSALSLAEAVEINQEDVRKSVVKKLLGVRTASACEMSDTMLSPEAAEYLVQWAKGESWFAHAAKASALTGGDPLHEHSICKQIVSSMENRQSIIRCAAVRCLVVLPHRMITADILAKWQLLLRDEDDDVRLGAVESLGSLGYALPPERLNEILLDILRDKAPRIVICGLDALQALREVLPITSSILSLLEDINKRKGIYSGEVSEKIAALSRNLTSEQLGAFLIRLSIVDPPSYMKLLNKIKAPSSEVSNLIENSVLDLLKDPDKIQTRLLSQIAFSSYQWSPNGHLINRLFSLLPDKRQPINDAVITAIARITKMGISAHFWQRLLVMLSDLSSSTRLAAAQIIAQLGEIDDSGDFPEELLEKLTDTFSHGNVEQRVAYVNAVATIGTTRHREMVIAKLYDLTKDRRAKVRGAALESLCSLVQPSSGEIVITKVLAALDDKSFEIRIAALGSLRKMSEQAISEDLVRRLFKMLTVLIGGNSSWQQRWRLIDFSVGWSYFLRRLSSSRMPRAFVAGAVADALMAIGTRKGTEDIFDKLVRSLGQAPWLLDVSLGLSNKASLARRGLGAVEEWGEQFDTLDHVVYSSKYLFELEHIVSASTGHSLELTTVHPLLMLAKHLPDKNIDRAISSLLVVNHVIAKNAALLLLKERFTALRDDSIASHLTRVFQDKEISLRLLGIDVAATIVSVNHHGRFIAVLQKCLLDNDSKVREKAFDSLLRLSEARTDFHSSLG